MVKFHTLFKYDRFGKVVPEINPECQWVLSTDNGLMTIKLDGACVKAFWATSPLPEWQIHLKGALDNDGKETWIKLDKDNPLDKPFWTAWKNLEIKQDGIYEVYGEGIKGNPHRIKTTLMIRIMPVDYNLIIARGNSKIHRGPMQTAKGLYDAIFDEFMESPEIEGLVFHLEDVGMKLAKAATITKKDFGIMWPSIIELPPSTDNTIPTV